MIEIYKITSELDGERLDVCVSACSKSAAERACDCGYDKDEDENENENAEQSGGITRSFAAKLIESGKVFVNGKPESKKYKVSAGDIISVDYPKAEGIDALPQNIPIDIVYEDDDIIVVNKPSGMVVHPAAGNSDGTLVNALLYHCKDSLSGIGGAIRPGIVHRIDKDTSGLIVVAKNDFSHLFLAGEIKDHKVSRVYYAIALGNIKEDSGKIDAPIGRHPTDRKKMAVIRSPERRARNAVTHYDVLERFGDFTFVKCRLETGRTHQIRVHMASIGHPLLGDHVYGGGNTKFEACNKTIINGQCLHAGELSLTHPRSHDGKEMLFTAPLPTDFEAVLEKLRKK